MSEFWVMVIIVVLNLVMILALGLVYTALAKVCEIEVDGRIKAGIIILIIVVSLIPYLNLVSLVVWFGATLVGIACYFDVV